MATSQGHYASASLYVGDLHRDVTEAMLYEVFNSVGPVASIRVCRDSSSRRSLGYAYVNYHSVGDAERALDTLNYTFIKNVPCRIMWSHRDPSLRKSGTGNIFVKNMDKSIDNKALYDTFSLFGNILSCKVAQDELGRSRGFGFVHYETQESAETAIERVNCMKIGNKTVYVGPFKKRNDRSSPTESTFTNVYVKNIPSEWSEDKLKEVFGGQGEVTSVALQTDGRERRFGFVNFTTAEAAKEAVDNLHGKKVFETKVKSEGEKENEDVKKEADNTTEAKDGTESSVKDNIESDKQNEDDDENAGLYVSRFQPRAERVALLKSKFDQSAEQRRKKLGVNLYVKNIHDSVNDVALRELFEPFGTITSAKVMVDDNGVSRGFGFVSFLSPDEATKAVTEMHLKLVEGKPLYVGLHEKREDRVHRLQQKLRVSHVRSRVPQGIPPQIQFGAPPQMYFGGAGGMQHPGGHMGFPPTTRNAMGAVPQAGMMPPWSRGQMPRGFGGPGQQQGMGPPMNIGGYAPVGPGGMNPSGGGSPMGMAVTSMGGPAGGVNNMVTTGGTPRGANVRMVNGQMGQQAGPAGPKQMPGGGGMAMPQQSQKPQGLKFPSQGVRTRDMDDSNMWAVAGGMGGMTNMHGGPVGDSMMPPGGMHGMHGVPVNADPLASATAMQKQMLGEKLFPRIASFHPTLAGKITGMMLDMDNAELLHLLESEVQLKAKVDEAIRVLQHAQQYPPGQQVSAVAPVSQQIGAEAEGKRS